MLMIKPVKQPYDEETLALINDKFKGESLDHIVCMRGVEEGEFAGFSAGLITPEEFFKIRAFDAHDAYTAELLARGILNRALNTMNKLFPDSVSAVAVFEISECEDKFEVFPKIGFKKGADGNLFASIERVLLGDCGDDSEAFAELETQGCNPSGGGCAGCSGCGGSCG